MPTDAPIGPTQKTDDLLVVFDSLAYCVTGGPAVFHVRDTATAPHLTLCQRQVVKSVVLPWHEREAVCLECRQRLDPDKYVVLLWVSYPALPITDERAAGRTLWSAKASCDDCGRLLSVEGTDTEMLGMAILAAKKLIDQHRDLHHSTTREQHMELLWPDAATPAITEHLRGIIVQAEAEKAAEEQEEGPSVTFTPVPPICEFCGVDLSQPRTTHAATCLLFDVESAARLAEWAAEDESEE